MCGNEFQLYFSHDKLYSLISARLKKNPYNVMFPLSNALTGLFLQFLHICSFSVIIKILLFLEYAYFLLFFILLKIPSRTKASAMLWGRDEEGNCFENGKYFKYYYLKTRQTKCFKILLLHRSHVK